MVQTVKRLLEAWRERVHPAASGEQVAIAFALLGGGAVLAVMGVLLVALGDTVLTRPSWLREVGFSAAATGLPLFLLGLVVGLPSRRWVAALSTLGTACVAVGVGAFVYLYPDAWYLTIQGSTAAAIGFYLFGVSALAASSAAELANYFVQRAQGTAGSEAIDENRPVTDAEIYDDLRWADKQGWSWGGIRGGRSEQSVTLKDDIGPVGFSGRGKRFILEEEGIEQPAQAVQALQALRGTKKPTTDSDVDNQVAYLKELKSKQASRQEARQESFWWKLTHPIQWLRG